MSARDMSVVILKSRGHEYVKQYVENIGATLLKGWGP